MAVSDVDRDLLSSKMHDSISTWSTYLSRDSSRKLDNYGLARYGPDIA